MRPIILSLCVFTAAACTGQSVDSPTGPATVNSSASSSAGSNVSSAQPDGSRELPFLGSFIGETRGAVNCPPECEPPTILTIAGTRTGTASHLGAFTATSVEVVDIAAATGTGAFNLTAANGDQLFTTTTGGEDGFEPPNISYVTGVGTIVGGTGRFAGASGTFTVHTRSVIDFGAQTSTETGSFEGHIILNK